jgi:hypothetical protein
MPVLIQTLGVVLPVFSIIGIGYLFASFKKISLDPLIDILLYLTIPALVISALLQKPLDPTDLFTVALSAGAVVLGVGVISYFYLGAIGRRDLRGFYLPTMFMNSGNMAFPLALLAFGADGLTVAVLYYIFIGIMVYSLGVYIAKGKGGLKEIFRLPLIYAAAISITLNLAHVEVPTPILSIFDMLGAATIPLMQISLGYRLHSVKFTLPGVSVASSVIRIAGGLAIAYGVTALLGIDGVPRKVILLSSAMPSAVINFIICERYNLQSDLVASIIATSTLISIITTPIIIIFLL